MSITASLVSARWVVLATYWTSFGIIQSYLWAYSNSQRLEIPGSIERSCRMGFHGLHHLHPFIPKLPGLCFIPGMLVNLTLYSQQPTYSHFGEIPSTQLILVFCIKQDPAN